MGRIQRSVKKGKAPAEQELQYNTVGGKSKGTSHMDSITQIYVKVKEFEKMKDKHLEWINKPHRRPVRISVVIVDWLVLTTMAAGTWIACIGLDRVMRIWGIV